MRVAQRNRSYELTDNETKLIEQLFNEGNGTGYIASRLKLAEGDVKRCLRAKGLGRSRAQAMEMRPKCWEGGERGTV